MLVAICRSVTDKIAKNDTEGWEKLAADFKNEDLDQPSLCHEINLGHAFTTHHKGRRKGANFKGAGYIALDFDNVQSQQEVETIMDHTLIRDYHAIFYHTPSATEDNPRFRVIFELENPIYDGEYYRDVVQSFIWTVGAVADQACKDPCRLFFGAKGSQPSYTGRKLPAPAMVEVLQEWREAKAAERHAAETRRVQEQIQTSKGGDQALRNRLQRMYNSLCDNIRNAPTGKRHEIAKDNACAAGGYQSQYGGIFTDWEVLDMLMEAAMSFSDADPKERRKVIEECFALGKTKKLTLEDKLQYPRPATTTSSSNQWSSNGNSSAYRTPGPVMRVLPPIDPTRDEPPPPQSETEYYTPNDSTDSREFSREKEETTPRRVIQFMRADALDQLPPLTYLIEGELPFRALVGLYGPSGGGKSFYALKLSHMIAQEDPVVYIASEGVYGYNKRIQALCEHTGLGRGWLYFYPAPANFMSMTETMAFIQAIRESLPRPPKLIVIDTMAWCMAGFGGDENSNSDMMKFLVNCELLKSELDCTVLIVHHVTKASGTFRGASAFINGLDTMIELNPDDELIRLECIKQKDDEKFETKYLKMKKVGDSCVLIEATKQEMDDITQGGRPQEALLDILEVLNYDVFAESGAKTQQLKEMLDVHQQRKNALKTLYKRLGTLKRADLITQGAKGDPFHITEAGKQTLRAYRPLSA